MTAAAFHALLLDPATGARLDRMIADNRRLDRALGAGPVIEVAIVPVRPDAPLTPVVEVTLEPVPCAGRCRWAWVGAYTLRCRRCGSLHHADR